MAASQLYFRGSQKAAYIALVRSTLDRRFEITSKGLYCMVKKATDDSNSKSATMEQTPVQRDDTPPCAASRQLSWIEETLNAAKSDTRRQPWKETFGENIDCSLDDGEDLFQVEKTTRDVVDPDYPFRTQGSGLAA
ncbi:hypothetical protein EG329_002649 [Mollisiaceae sp. DMI_Dod_QoI]|nr:hypothetical protein EG329_002649 [Helotiales sp. DMI_Dod_QoI]